MNDSAYFLKTKLIAVLVLLLLSGCASTRQPVPPGVVPNARVVSPQDEQYGHSVLNQLSEKYELDFDDKRLDRAIEIVDKLTEAAGADASPWHVYLFKAPEVVNAAATRGNHVFLWSGMLDKTQNDSELATILGHEIAHVLASHTEPDPGDQVRKILVGLGGVAAGIAVTAATKNPAYGRTLGNLTSSLTQEIGSGLLVYPYSRDLELEADQIGLFIMADAGYDPEHALNFWTRAEQSPDFSKNFEFFSSHPMAKDRLTRVAALLPAAKERYRSAIGLTPKTRTKLQPSKPQILPQKQAGLLAPNSWRVVEKNITVFSAASSSSKKLGELSQNQRVLVLGTGRGWVEIEEPIKGFVRGGTLEPLN